MSTLLCRLCLLLSIVALWIVEIDTKEVRIVCYYTNWSVYRPGDAKFNPQNINPYLCTHLIYAFGGFTKENTLKPFDKYQDVEKGGYAKFVGLKTYNKNLKTLLAIGGWNEGSTRFSPMVANAERRKELIKNAIKFLRQNHFDGLDLDWEYPSFRDGGKSRDRDNYAQLVQELREEFERESEKTGRPRLLLTMAVPAGIEYINKGYDVPKLTKYLDWMNILSYDYHSAYEPAVNHHSPLYSIEEESEYSYDIDLNIDYTINHYLKNGADKSKLVLGIPTYGRSYTLYNPEAFELGAPADGPGEMGDATRENGYLAYYEICESLKSDDWTIESPYPDIMGPYAYNGNQWVGYDDEDIARKKAEYVAENGLGGIMFWSIDNDDFRGKCGGKPYPIIEAAKEALLKAYGLTDASLLETTKKPIKSRTKTRGTTKSIETTTEVSPSVKLRQNTRRKNANRAPIAEETSTGTKRRPTVRRKKPTTESVTSGSSLIVTPSYTTPAPPSTPDTGGDFKCEDEGFFPHPRDCKKYFWCLSGPSELGIVAHQFTCPAGLYFNKAASSCDYTQNVLCNKKLSKPTTTTTTTAEQSTTSSTTSAPVSTLFSTKRPLPKITAATSRTTYTTARADVEEEEYEEYEDDDPEEGDTEQEDPRVIKELIELIKKAGGIEELEKQLKFQDSGSSSVDSTTRSSINKALYEKVLSRASATLRDSQNSKNSFSRNYNSISRNSRGPQNEGLEQTTEGTLRSNRVRPQYTSILRSRSSTEGPRDVSDATDVKEQGIDEETSEKPGRGRLSFKKTQPEYVTIRRQRISTTTVETPENLDKLGMQFEQLGEAENEENQENEEYQSRFKSSTTSSPYVTIRRSRPTTATPERSEDSIEGNQQVRRKPPGHTEEMSSQSPEYIIVNRQRPGHETTTSTTSRYVEIRSRGTTSSDGLETIANLTTSKQERVKSENSNSPQDDSANFVEENTVETYDDNHSPVTETYTKNDTFKDVVDDIKDITGIGKEIEKQPTSDNVEEEKKRPILSDPRPFSITRSRPTISSVSQEIATAKEVKVSVTTPRNALRNKILQARKSLSSRNVNNEELNDNSKDNNVLDDNEHIRASAKLETEKTDRSRFISRKRFRNEISSETPSPNTFVDASNNENEENKENTEYKIRVRSRGQSRYTQQTVATTVRSRPIARITDLPYNDYDTSDYNRKYRPDISAEIADLSSLTAVDLKEVSARGRSNNRRRVLRPIAEQTTTTTTITPESEEESKAGSRTVPLARKLLDTAQFGKSNRFRVTTSATTTTTTLNHEEPEEHSESITPPKFRRPIPRGVNSTNTFTDSIRANRFRRINSNTTIPQETSTVASATNSTVRVPPTRRRIVLRKRVNQTFTSSSTTVPTSPSSTEALTSSTETNAIIIENIQSALQKNESGLTESNKSDSENGTSLIIRKTHGDNSTENNDAQQQRKASVKPEQVKPEEDKSNEEEDDTEEDENIKLSESNIRENSQLGNFQNGNVIQEGLKPGKLNSFKPLIKDVEEEKPLTEASIAFRTRKIIRKLGSTESPSLATENFDGQKIKKIIRRLKPTTTSINSLETSERTIEASTVSLFNKERKKFGLGRTESVLEEESIKGSVKQNNRPLFTRRRFGSTAKDTLTTSKSVVENSNEHNADESSDEVQEEKEIDEKPKPLFTRKRFGVNTLSKLKSKLEESKKSDEASDETVKEIANQQTNRQLFTRRRFGGQASSTTKSSGEVININKSIYNKNGVTSSTTSTSTESPKHDEETITSGDEVITQTTEDLTTSEILASTEYTILETTQSSTGNDPTVTDEAFTELTTEVEASSSSTENSTTAYGSTRYGEQESVVTSTTSTLPPLNTTKRGNRLSFKNGIYGTTSNNLVTPSDDDQQINKILITTESALSKLLKRRKFATTKLSTTQDADNEDYLTDNKERSSVVPTVSTTTEETKNTSKESLEESTKSSELAIDASTIAEKSSDLTTELFNLPTDSSIATSQPSELTTEDINTTFFNEQSMTTESKIESTSETDTTDDNEETIPTTTEEKYTKTLTSTIPTVNTTSQTQSSSIISSTRKPGRLFKPIASRPKFTGRFKSESTSATPLTSVSTERTYKTNRFNRFKTKPASNRFTSSTTERDENEELGYGPVKDFKPAFKPNLALYRPRNKYTQEDDSEEEYEEGESSEEQLEDNVGTQRQYPRPGLFSKPTDKPEKPHIILKDSGTPEEEEEDAYDEYDESQNKEEEADESQRFNPTLNVNPSSIYFGSTQKPSTRSYKKFKSSTPFTPAQNLSDVNITAVNQRNRNLFNKTRKANTPFAGVTVNIPKLELKQNISTTTASSDIPYQVDLFTTSETSTVTSDEESRVEETTESKSMQTTEKATTLWHVFAETESPISDSTLIYNYNEDEEAIDKKIEKIVEINRIIKVTAKEQGQTLEKEPQVDRLLVSRVTEIKVVEAKNNTNSSENNKETRRQEKKYDSNPKTDYGFNIPVVTNSDIAQINQIHIDSSSVVNKITPKPFPVETATIPLEALFQTQSPFNKVDLQNELLEAENSNYVHVRILEQDSPNSIGRLDTSAKFVPIKILKYEDEVTMKADVVEVMPSNEDQKIKIVPIAVSIQNRANT